MYIYYVVFYNDSAVLSFLIYDPNVMNYDIAYIAITFKCASVAWLTNAPFRDMDIVSKRTKKIKYYVLGILDRWNSYFVK